MKNKTRRLRKRRRRRKSTAPLTLLNLKVTAADRRALNAAAKRYARGNLSAWLRLAGIRFRPVKTQFS